MRARFRESGNDVRSVEWIAASPLGSTEGFEAVWNHVAEKLLTSYSRRDVRLRRLRARAVGRPDAGGRSRAGRHDDPPERIGAWLATVATSVAARARPDAGARPAAHRAGRRTLGRADDAGRRAARGSAARRRLRRRDRSWSRSWRARPARRERSTDAPAARDHRDRLLVAGPMMRQHRRPTSRRSTRRSSSASRRCACRSARSWSGRSPKRCRSRSGARHARAADGDPARVRRRSAGGRSSG